jgi:acetylornithine deacetylase/succinyl-diaminopimelate desuccinylase-like protein
MQRLALREEDVKARNWLVEECKALSCDVKIDQMGNIFAIRPGTSPDRIPIAMGSHLDTQPAGNYNEASTRHGN